MRNESEIGTIAHFVEESEDSHYTDDSGQLRPLPRVDV